MQDREQTRKEGTKLKDKTECRSAELQCDVINQSLRSIQFDQRATRLGALRSELFPRVGTAKHFSLLVQSVAPVIFSAGEAAEGIYLALCTQPSTLVTFTPTPPLGDRDKR